jgi:biotin-dependent carboxylase-like uncharacterized protein
MAVVVTVRRASLATVTDLGRRGLARDGIASNGAADQYSARVANILAGNAERRPLIEIIASDFSCTLSQPGLIAVTGAPADVFVGNRRVRMWEPVCVGEHDEISIRGMRAGLCTYLAVNGNFEVPFVLGSCAPDTLLGTRRWLRSGSELTVESDYRELDHPLFRHPVFRLGATIPRFGSPWTIEVSAGPDAADFPDLGLMFGAGHAVGTDSDHIGVRLLGPVPVRGIDRELLSRGVPIGAVEVPPSGGLIVLRRGRPVTAGYPVVAVVATTAMDRIGQVRPGDVIRFQHQSVADAVAALRWQRRDLDALATRAATVFTALGVPATVPADRAHIERTYLPASISST